MSTSGCCPTCFDTNMRVARIECALYQLIADIGQRKRAIVCDSNPATTHEAYATDCFAYATTAQILDEERSDDEEGLDDAPHLENRLDTENSPEQCPYEDCESKAKVWPKRGNLLRHFKTHISCNEECVFCGSRSTTVKTYTSHWRRCKDRHNDPRLLQIAKGKHRNLHNIAVEQLDKLLSEHVIRAGQDSVIASSKRQEISAETTQDKSSKANVTRDNSRKRGPDFVIASNKRQQMSTNATEDTLNMMRDPNSTLDGFAIDQISHDLDNSHHLPPEHSSLPPWDVRAQMLRFRTNDWGFNLPESNLVYPNDVIDYLLKPSGTAEVPSQD